MPFIDSKITVRLTEEKKEALKSKLGATMPVLGKSETYLMVGITTVTTCGWAEKSLKKVLMFL